MLTPDKSAANEPLEGSRGPLRVPGDLAVAALSGIAAFLIAGTAELGAIRLVGADPQALDWVSDVILAVAFAAAVLLRLRLKASRAEMSPAGGGQDDRTIVVFAIEGETP